MSERKRVLRLSDLVVDRSVAIVGNSERILRDRPGKIIDRADVVIRMNRGLPGVIDQRAIGYRTDIWATAKYWPDLKVPEDCGAVLWMKLTALGKRQLPMMVNHIGAQCPIFVWTRTDEQDCRAFVGADPGTGIRILWWLRTHAKPRSVSVFGMDCWEENSHWSGKKNTPNHKPDLERAAMLRLL